MYTGVRSPRLGIRAWCVARAIKAQAYGHDAGQRSNARVTPGDTKLSVAVLCERHGMKNRFWSIYRLLRSM